MNNRIGSGNRGATFGGRANLPSRPVTIGPAKARTSSCPSIDWRPVSSHRAALRLRIAVVALLLPSVLFIPALPLNAREKDKTDYGVGLRVDIPLPESEVAQVVADIAQNGIIRGTKEYNKDEYIKGAVAAASTHVFPEWSDGGKVFFKVRKQALDPRNFKDSSDIGTLAVRYIVQTQGERNTVLRIDATFVEDFRHTAHLSNGSVEAAEYKDIKDHLDAIELMKTQTVEAEKERQEQLVKKQQLRMAVEVPQSPPAQPTPKSTAGVTAETREVRSDAPSSSPNPPSAQTLEQHVQDLRRQVERVVKAPGSPLKSAPFHTASTLQSLASGTELLVLISTPYWYGVETRDGQHGWIARDQLEQLP